MADIDKTATGQDAVVKLNTDASNSPEIVVSNVSWTRDVNTNDVQLNDSMNPTHVTTGLRYSGSFEYDGRDFDLNSELLLSDATEQLEANHPVQGNTLTVTERPQPKSDDSSEKYIYTFKNVKITSQSRDMPSDGSSSTSWDWIAEDLSVTSSSV
jgi:hypothetical protein